VREYAATDPRTGQTEFETTPLGEHLFSQMAPDSQEIIGDSDISCTTEQSTGTGVHSFWRFVPDRSAADSRTVI
jgi:hypothetical protein